jgi:hypothetical protein
VKRYGEGQEVGGHVPPENQFFIARLLFEKRTVWNAMRRPTMMKDAGERAENDSSTGPTQAEGQVHVLKIAAERFGEASDSPKGIFPIKGAGTARAEHFFDG